MAFINTNIAQFQANNPFLNFTSRSSEEVHGNSRYNFYDIAKYFAGRMMERQQLQAGFTGFLGSEPQFAMPGSDREDRNSTLQNYDPHFAKSRLALSSGRLAQQASLH